VIILKKSLNKSIHVGFKTTPVLLERIMKFLEKCNNEGGGITTTKNAVIERLIADGLTVNGIK
jgi:hypothetical protein